MKTKIFVAGLFSILLVCGIIVSLRSHTEANPLKGLKSEQVTPVALPVWYIGQDRTTLGNWYDQVPGDNYGNCAWILGAMNAFPTGQELPVPEDGNYQFYDVYGGPLMNSGCGLDYKVYTCTGAAGCDIRAVEHPDESKRRATCYWSSGTETIQLTIPGPGSYQLAVYVLDWDSYARSETISVTNSSSSASYSVSNFHDGKYVLFQVNVGAPSDIVTISIAKIGGANPVVSGIFIDPSPSGTYPREDISTKGDWVGTYGSSWFLLCALDSIYTWSNTQPEDPTYDVTGGSLGVTYTVSNGNYWAWTDYCEIASQCNVLEPGKQKDYSFAWSWGPDTTGYGLEVPNPWSYVVYPVPKPLHLLGTAAWASCYDDGGENYDTGPDLYIELTLPEADGCSLTNCYQVSFYATDYDSSCRKQVIEIYNPTNGDLLARTHDPSADPPYGFVGPGVYHTFFMPAGTYLVKVDYYGCTNAILSGIFVDCVECPHGTGDMRTIGFWKHQFAVATENNKGKAKVKSTTLEDYLATISSLTSLTDLQGLDLAPAYSILWPTQPADMCTRARQQVLALWLNYASGAVAWNEMVYNVLTGEYVQFNVLIYELEDAINSGDCENAKTIADWLNNSGYE